MTPTAVLNACEQLIPDQLVPVEPDNSTQIISISEYVHNYAALAQAKRDFVNALVTCLASVLVFGLMLDINLLAAVGLLQLIHFNVVRLKRIAKLHDVIKLLLDRFGDENIQVTANVRTNTTKIDLFVKFPDKRRFALMLRTHGKVRIYWREDREKFIAVSSKSHVAWDAPNYAIDNLKTVIDLVKQKHLILGGTTAERNKPINKVIVLTEETTIHASRNPAHLWHKFGRTKALRVYRGGSAYVIEQSSLIDFLLPPLEN